MRSLVLWLLRALISASTSRLMLRGACCWDEQSGSPGLGSRSMGPMFAAVSWPVIDRVHLGGSFALSPHGVFIAVGFLLGSWWVIREGVRRGIAIDDLNNAVMLALIGAVIGSRFFYVVGHFSEFKDDLISIFKIWQGGITLLGGIVGAFLANIPMLRKRGYRFFQGADSAAMGMAFGLAVGRLGDLIIGDHLGKPTSWLLSFAYKGGQLAGFACDGGVCTTTLPGGRSMVLSASGATLMQGQAPIAAGIGVHQTALYDLIGTALLFLTLYWFSQKQRREGVLFCVFLLWYGTERIITDFLRIDKTIFGLTGSQWTSVAAVSISAILLLKWSFDKKRFGPLDPRPTTFFVAPAEPGSSSL